jgi:hypothetical protein
MANTRIKDPRQLPVQLNVSLPWAFREFLSAQAERDKTSLNKLAVQALRDKYGKDFDLAESRITRHSTRLEGSTA